MTLERDESANGTLRIFCAGLARPVDSVVRQIDEKFENLAHFPFIGRDRPSLAQGIRSIVSGMYAIFYEVEINRIVIVRVLDGRRDIDAEFQR